MHTKHTSQGHIQTLSVTDSSKFEDLFLFKDFPGLEKVEKVAGLSS